MLALSHAPLSLTERLQLAAGAVAHPLSRCCSFCSAFFTVARLPFVGEKL